MLRRNFIKNTFSLAGFCILPIRINRSIQKTGDRSNDNWYHLGTGKKGTPIRQKVLEYDVCVIGGGMAGISAAVSAARNGAKTILIQDRPVLGGNASSEIRVTVGGAILIGRRIERETGIIEEMLIENRYYNHQESYPVWDHVLYNYVGRQINLDLMLNTQAVKAVMEGKRIKAAVCWQITSEIEFTIFAKQFIDCSGDGLLASDAGAEYRTGREGKNEFDESFAPDKPDGWVMGDTIMMITRDTGKPAPFIAPDYAIPFNAEKALKDRNRQFRTFKEGYWWIELGSDYDIIAESETIRHKLLAHFYGVWDYIKNSGNYPEAKTLALDWIGSLPGRRESRRFMGDYILSQRDMLEYRHFWDAVAYGGWSLDEHCPGGIENLDEPASYYHARFEKPYEIPYRCLYSKNIENLSFAGRNVSVTHIALSSTRIIGTCAMMGQAAGTGAALCVKKNIDPRIVATEHINELQEQLLRDDQYIPNRPANDKEDLARKSASIEASSTHSGDVSLLLDGFSRDEINKVHHWEANDSKAVIRLNWDQPIDISKVELKCNTNLQKQINMVKDPEKNDAGRYTTVPPELIRSIICEVLVDGKWKEVFSVEDNITRLVKMHFDTVKTKSVQLKINGTWGNLNARLYEVRCYS